MAIVLRDYQQDIKDKIYNSWNAGNRNVLAVLPTGGGKSVVMSTIVREHHEANQKCAVIAHRNELVNQMSCHLGKQEIPHRIIGSKTTISAIVRKHRSLFGKSFVNPSAVTAVVGVDTLVSKNADYHKWAEQIDLWLQDESHHLLVSNKWGKAIEMFKNARGLGVTATPSRADGQGLGREYDGFFDDIIIGPSTRWLINKGNLAEYEIVCPPSDLNPEGEKLSKNGDWSPKTLKRIAKKSKIVGDVVGNYLKYAKGRKAIVFATDVETADEIAKDFNENGVRAVSLNGKSKTSYREQSIEGFSTGNIEVLVNVDLFDEGFDVPTCDVVIMARPTASLGKDLQMIGRGLRPAPGKTALIIDHVSNVLRHGLPDKYRPWTLARREKRGKQEKDPDEIPLTTCKNCLKPYEQFRTICPYCGSVKPLPDPASRTIEMVEGDLILLDKATLDRMRANTLLEDPQQISNRVSMVAGAIAGKGVANRQVEKIAAQSDLKEVIAQWAAIEREKGYNDREIHKRFYLTTGMTVLECMSRDRKKQDYITLTDRIRGWYERSSSN